jgi:hypothetical protein
MKHNKLTPEQEAKMLEYRDAGIKIAMSTHDESMWDVKEIESICQAHRVMCGVPAATKLEVFDSPMAAESNSSSANWNCSNAWLAPIFGPHSSAISS